MDLTAMITVPLLAGFGGWFGSFLNGYSTEKGKNLATHEDIDKLVDQVKAVTQTTKEIEAKISDQVWDRQRRWELKRDQILKIADLISTAKDSLVYLDSECRQLRMMSSQGEASIESFEKRAASFTDDLNQLDRLVVTTSLICDAATVVAITNYTITVRQIASQLIRKEIDLDFEGRHADINKKFAAVIGALKTELT